MLEHIGINSDTRYAIAAGLGVLFAIASWLIRNYIINTFTIRDLNESMITDMSYCHYDMHLLRRKYVAGFVTSAMLYLWVDVIISIGLAVPGDITNVTTFRKIAMLFIALMPMLSMMFSSAWVPVPTIIAFLAGLALFSSTLLVLLLNGWFGDVNVAYQIYAFVFSVKFASLIICIAMIMLRRLQPRVEYSYRDGAMVRTEIDPNDKRNTTLLRIIYSVFRESIKTYTIVSLVAILATSISSRHTSLRDVLSDNNYWILLTVTLSFFLFWWFFWTVFGYIFHLLRLRSRQKEMLAEEKAAQMAAIMNARYSHKS